MLRVDVPMINATGGSLTRFMRAGYSVQEVDDDGHNGTADISGNKRLSPLHTALSGYAACRCTENSGLSAGSHASSGNTVAVSAAC